MKKILIVLFMAALLTGCGHRPKIPHNGYDRFKVVETYLDGYEVVDVDTGWSYYVFNGGGIVTLYDEYGDTYRANGWRDFGE